MSTLTKTGQPSVHMALLRFTQARQSKPEPTSLDTMPAKGVSLGDISVLVFVLTCACMRLFLTHIYICFVCVCL